MADGRGANQQVGDQPEPDSQYGQALSNAHGTPNLLKSVDQFIGSPISKVVTRRERVEWMWSYLGQWYQTLYEDQSTLWIPILKADKFSDYITRTNGNLRPTGKNFAHAPWAHLLHALGINPPADSSTEEKRPLTTISLRSSIYPYWS